MLTLAFDEGPGVGLGHRRRVEGVAHALHALGCAAECRPLDGSLVTGEVVLVDSYLVRADDRDRVQAEIVVAIDDIERNLAVDLVVDPDPGADPRVHAAAGQVLAGAPYALVDPALGARPTEPLRAEVRRVLVTTGGADAAGIGARLASGLAAELPEAAVRLVVGPWGRASDDPRVEQVRAPAGLAAELAAADLVVTAGGVTMLEACCLGRPTVALSIAANQTRAIAGVAHVGAVLAADAGSAAAVAARLAHDVEARRRLSASARALIDGQGATRAAVVVAAMSRHGIHAF